MTIRISPDTRARIKARREHFTLLRTSQEIPEVLPELSIEDLVQLWNSGPAGKEIALKAADRNREGGKP